MQFITLTVPRSNDFYHQAITPAIFLLRERLHFPNKLDIRVCQQNACSPAKLASTHPNLYITIFAQILHPIRTRVLGDDIEMPAQVRKPYLNLPRQPTIPTARGEIKVLLALEITFL